MGSNDSLAFAGQQDLGAQYTVTYTTAKHVVGTRSQGSDGREFVFIQADGAIAVGDIIAYADGYDCAPLTGAGVAWAVANTAIADNEFGWVQTRGPVASAAVETGPADGARLGFVTGSNGFLDDQASPDATDPVFAVQVGAQSGNLAGIFIR